MTTVLDFAGLAVPVDLPPTWLTNKSAPIARQRSSAFVEPMVPEYLREQMPNDLVATEEVRFVAASPRNFVKAAGALISYLELEQNWDGEGAEAPSQETIWHALDMLEVIPDGIDAPKTMVLASGDVALYWDQGDTFAEIGFARDGCYYAYAKRPGYRPVHLDDVPVHDEIGMIRFPADILALLIPVSLPVAA